MLNSLAAQQQPQAAAGTLSIEQLLRAAKLIEQRAINDLLSGTNNNAFGLAGVVPSTAATFTTMAKLGEGYQERLLSSKMRVPFADPNIAAVSAPNSTGSSRRSSPISASSSSPNSPDANNHPMAPGRIRTPPMLQQQQGNMPNTSTAPLNHQQQQFAGHVRASSSASSTPSNCGGGGTSSRRVSGTRQSRAAHNELEKNRRANLRGHLEALKSVLPPESDTHRDTTLSLLTRARNYIRYIKEQKGALAEKRAALLAEHLRLRQLLLQNGGIVQEEEAKEEEEEVVQQQKKLPSPTRVFLSGHTPSTSSTPSSSTDPIDADEPLADDIPRAESRHQNDAVEDENVAKPDMHFLTLNGLLPALPLLYPYSSMSPVGGTPCVSPMGQIC